MRQHWFASLVIVVGSAVAYSAAQTSGLQPPNLNTSPKSAEAGKEIPLYTGVAPGSEKWDWSEKSTKNAKGVPMVQNVVKPALLHYPVDRAKSVGTAMIVAPGGGFTNLMMSYEGVDIAERLNQLGIEAFVLKYRLKFSGGNKDAQAGQNVNELASEDGKQAVRVLRERAKEFGVPPDRIGIIGFSAGGQVAFETLFGPAETRPNFGALIYGSKAMKEMPKPAPPLFLAAAADDANSTATLNLFSAYQKEKGPAELHIFQMGAHGFVNKGGGADHFMDRLEEWLKVNKLLTKPAN